MSIIIDTARGSRLGTALFVIISPVIILAATITALFVTTRDILVEELPEFFREDIAPAFRFAFVEPILTAYVAALVAFANYRERVRDEYRYFVGKLRWFIGEASDLVTRKQRASFFWTRIAAKYTLSSAGALIKRVVGL